MIQNGGKLLKQMLDALLPNRASPVLARVLKGYEGAGKTRYSVDVRVLKAGTLEDTEQVISEVPITPLWAAKKKRGVYAIPNEGQVVIVEFISWNPAYPYIAGIWSDDYEADSFSKNKFLITDGDGMKFEIDADGKKITIDNGKKSVITLEENKITCDNGKLQVILNGDKASVKNGSKSLFTILDTHIKNVLGMKTVGSPAQHVVSPPDIQKFTQDGADLAALMEA
jgi:phage baseplate assembly protein gpV